MNIVALDEVGRGAISGPVVVAGTFWKQSLQTPHWVNQVKDSKQLTPRLREKLLEDFQNTLSQPIPMTFESYPEKKLVSSFNLQKNSDGPKAFKATPQDVLCLALSAQDVDEKGIWNCIQALAASIISQFHQKYGAFDIWMDGSLPTKIFKDSQTLLQKTFIKGDIRFKEIGLSSIVAKVLRDSYMTKLDAQWPKFMFSQHKGYGTAFHRSVLKNEITREHRKTFLTKILS